MYKKALAVLLALVFCTLGACSVKQDAHPPAPPTQAASATPVIRKPIQPPQQTPAPTPAPPAMGDTGEITKALQDRLVALGYLPKDAQTGVWDARSLHCANLLLTKAGKEPVSALDANSCAFVLSDDAPTCAYSLAGRIIGLDPGHQAKPNSNLEPVAPNASKTKPKVSSGTRGKWSGLSEYEVNLSVALLLRDLLVSRGAIVVMTRETNDVDVSNAARAILFNESLTDYALRLHCNGTSNSNKRGAFVLVPKNNPFQTACVRAAELLLDAYCAETGLKSRGLSVRSDQTGFNWCERMIINIEMGHMTNRFEDLLLGDPAFQSRMAAGLCAGIERYFAPEAD